MGKGKKGRKLGEFEYDHSGVLKTLELPKLEDLKGPTPAVALDCEMVGVCRNGKKSTLARVSIVNEHGFCLYDSFVSPHVPVTDHQARIKGIRKTHLKNAPPFGVVVKKVRALIEGRILIGHGLEHSLTALGLEAWFPLENCRDTSVYFLPEDEDLDAPALWDLVHKSLGRSIHVGELSSITEAQAAMAVYQHHKIKWEKRQKSDRAERDRWILEGRIFDVKDGRKVLVAPLSYRSTEFYKWETE